MSIRLFAQTQGYRVCCIALLLEYKSHYFGTQGHQSPVWFGTVNVLEQREDLVNSTGKICFLLHPCSSTSQGPVIRHGFQVDSWLLYSQPLSYGWRIGSPLTSLKSENRCSFKVYDINHLKDIPRGVCVTQC